MADNIEMRVAKLETNMNHLRQEFMETLQGAYDRACADQDEESAAQFARLIRNKLLDSTDKHDTVDQMFKFDLPDSITMTNIIAAVKAVITGIKAIGTNTWSVYRQHLRDIPEQAGFPFNIDWGTPPDEGNQTEE